MDAQMCNNAEMAVIGIIVPLQILPFDALFLFRGDVWFSLFWGKNVLDDMQMSHGQKKCFV